MPGFLKDLWANPLIRAQILAGVRHLVTIVGTALIAHGYLKGDGSTALIEQAAGFAVAIVSFYFSQTDVKKVDAKMTKAIAMSPQSPTDAVNALRQGLV